MPSSDDTIIIGGPLKAVLAWLWKYRLRIFGLEFRSLWFFVALTLTAFGLGKLF